MANLVARFATAEETQSWNDRVAANPGGGEVWMGNEYLEQKRHGRYHPLRVILERRTEETAIAVGVLTKRVPGLGTWWHVPAGPTGVDVHHTIEMVRAVGKLAKQNGAFFVKVEPRLSPDAHGTLTAQGLVKTFRIVPNESTVLLSLEKNPDDVFSRFPKKTRYAIRKATRDGVVVERAETSDANCEAFYRLLEETGEGRFLVRSEEYYRTYWQRFQSAGKGQLFLASRDGELVAGAFVMALGERATYKDGASVRTKQAYGASHALQWEAIQWAIEAGAEVYDFCGAPPSNRVDDKTHPLHGVGAFKLSFAPEVTDYVGAYDLPLKPLAYRIWSAVGDRIARRASLLFKRDPYY